jgi:glucokinase
VIDPGGDIGGTKTLLASQLVSLQPAKPMPDAPRLVVGAGTGLGMAIVLPQGEAWRVVAGEGGHIAFAPADEQQAALWRIPPSTAWSRHLGTSGFRPRARRHPRVPRRTPGNTRRQSRTAHWRMPRATRCRAGSLDLFLAAYGAFAGDMALACLARGGVFLAGGIAAKLLPVIAASPFLAAFNAKAEHAGIAARMPVHVATDGLLGLRGALCLAGEEKPLQG